MQQIYKRLPKHIAIIMDGNGRWATKLGLERSDGHKAGAKAVRTIVSECRKLGIEYLTLYAFSKENWKRPKLEIGLLFDLLVQFVRSELPELIKQEIRLEVLGDIEKLPLASKTALKQAMKTTSKNKKLTLCLALNYSGREEIVQACKKIIANNINLAELDEEKFKDFLYLPQMPDPDLIIRTSGEIRLSNFLLYQCAYSELYFTNTFWPDFDAQELDKALKIYEQRERKFGDIKVQTELSLELEEQNKHGN